MEPGTNRNTTMKLAYAIKQVEKANGTKLRNWENGNTTGTIFLVGRTPVEIMSIGDTVVNYGYSRLGEISGYTAQSFSAFIKSCVRNAA